MRDDGGQAYPSIQQLDWDGDPVIEHFGMTLRDYFASKALIGKLTHGAGNCTREYLADECYAMADAMIVARNK